MRRHKESRWWNEEIAALTKEKQRLFKLLKGPKKCTWKAESRNIIKQEEPLRELSSLKRMLRGRSFVRIWRGWEVELFRLAKQLVSKNRDVVRASCVKVDDGKIVVEEDKLMEVWRAHYDKISNEEVAWDRNRLTNVSPVCGSSERISALEVGVAIGKMKQGKSTGPKGVVAEMLKAAGETGTMWMTDVCNAVVKDGKVPED